MTALDASVLIAHLRGPDDAHHDRARTLLGADDTFQIHSVNLAEALVAPVRASRDADALEAWRALGVTVWSGEDEALGLARLRASTPLQLPDCCALLVAERLDHPLATFDETLAGVARQRGVTVLDPA